MKSNTLIPEKKDRRSETPKTRFIKLDDLHFVTRNSLTWILHFEDRRGISEKTGKEIIATDEWYFPSLKLCLKKYCDRVLLPAQSIQDILNRIESLERKIDELCKD